MRENKIDPSVLELTEEYFHSKQLPYRELISFYFCDNEKDANECAELTLKGTKRATASSLWGYKESNEVLPKESDLSVVTNWSGIAQCIIQVKKVEIVPFNEITPQFAEEEGEGGKSLEYWKKVHWSFYQRELKDSLYSPTQDMPVVCEYFKKVFPTK